MEHQNQEMEEVVAVDQQRLEKVGVVEQQNQEMEEVVAAEGQRNLQKAEVVEQQN
jgi:ribosomal protein S19E (S16A)